MNSKKTRSTAGSGYKVFEPAWGIHQSVLAEQEQITESAILMRICHFGTPWQRYSRPGPAALIYGRSWGELSALSGLSVKALMARQKQHGDIRKRLGGQCRVDWDWVFSQDPGQGFDLGKRGRFWLRTEHPDYLEARKPIWLRSGDYSWSVRSCRM